MSNVSHNRDEMRDYGLTLEGAEGVSYYLSRELLEGHGILVAFTTRHGGCSTGPYASLNLAFHVGDDARDVVRNRQELCGRLGLDPARLTCAEQVHGAGVAVVAGGNAGAGALSLESAVKGADALVTHEVGVPLALFFADCVPVIIVDPDKRVVAVVHAGWRGVYAGIIGNAIATMKQKWASSTDALIAFIGPSIGGCCYEVSPDLIRSFSERFGEGGAWHTGSTMDLPALCRVQLEASGIAPAAIYRCDECCTACNNGQFFSYRADGGVTGRQAALAAIVT